MESLSLEAAQDRVRIVQRLTGRVALLRRRIGLIQVQRKMHITEVVELADADAVAARAGERVECDWWGRHLDCQLVSEMITAKFNREAGKGKEAARTLVSQRATLEARRSKNALLPQRAENQLELRLLRKLRADRDAEIRDKLAWVGEQWSNEKRIRKKLSVEAYMVAQQDQVRLAATSAAVTERSCQMSMADRVRCTIRSLTCEHVALELRITSLAAGAGWNDENEVLRDSEMARLSLRQAFGRDQLRRERARLAEMIYVRTESARRELRWQTEALCRTGMLSGEWIASVEQRRFDAELEISQHAHQEAVSLALETSEKLERELSEVTLELRNTRRLKDVCDRVHRAEILSLNQTAAQAIGLLKAQVVRQEERTEELRRAKNAEITAMAAEHASQVADLAGRLEHWTEKALRREKWVQTLKSEMAAMKTEAARIAREREKKDHAHRKIVDGLTTQLRTMTEHASRLDTWVNSLKGEVKMLQDEIFSLNEAAAAEARAHASEVRRFKWEVWRRDETARMLRTNVDCCFLFFVETVAELAGSSHDYNKRLAANAGIEVLVALCGSARLDIRRHAAHALGKASWNGYQDFRVTSRNARDAWSGWVSQVSAVAALKWAVACRGDRQRIERDARSAQHEAGPPQKGSSKISTAVEDSGDFEFRFERENGGSDDPEGPWATSGRGYGYYYDGEEDIHDKLIEAKVAQKSEESVSVKTATHQARTLGPGRWPAGGISLAAATRGLRRNIVLPGDGKGPLCDADAGVVSAATGGQNAASPSEDIVVSGDAASEGQNQQLRSGFCVQLVHNTVHVVSVDEALKTVGANLLNQDRIGRSHLGLSELARLSAESDLECRRHASNALAVLTLDHANRSRLSHDRSALVNMVDLCVSDDEESQRNAAACIGNMVYKHRSNQDKLGCISGGIGALVNLCAARDLDVVDNASAALANAAFQHEENARLIGACGGVAVLIPLCHASAAAAEKVDNIGNRIQQNAAEALVNITRNMSSENSTVVQKCGVGPLVLMCSSSYLPVQRCSALILGNVAQNDLSRERAGSEGAVEALFLLSENDDDEVRVNAMWAMSNLAWNAANQERIGKFLPQLLDLCCHPTNEMVRQNATMALANSLFYHEGNRRRMGWHVGALSRLVSLTSDVSAKVREHASRALGTAAHNDENAAQIGEVGGVEALVTLCGGDSEHSMHNAYPEVQRYAAFALGNLGLHAPNKSRILLAGGVEALTRLYGSKHPHTQQCAADALEVLADVSKKEDLAARKGGFGVADLVQLAAGDDGNPNPMVQGMAAEALAEEAWNKGHDAQLQIAKAKGIEALVSLAGGQSGAQPLCVRARALWAIRNVVHANKELQNRLGAAGGIDVLLRCAAGDLGDGEGSDSVLEVQEAALTSLVNAIVDNERNSRRVLRTGLDTLIALAEGAMPEEIQSLALDALQVIGPHNWVLCGHCGSREVGGNFCSQCGHTITFQ